MDHFIRVRGARLHNLKNIDVTLPKNQIVIITGLSGSGKSSLAFDTLYAEGQRRYVESLSAYARQFLQLMEKPDVDSIEGLSPSISIEQKATSHNPRSTVGTVTEIHDYLRLLFARVGTARCPTHHLSLEAQTISQMVDHVLALPQDTKIMLVAPLVQDRKGEHLELFTTLQSQGFVKFRIDKTLYDLDLDGLPSLQKNQKHTIEVMIDRLKVRSEHQQRLAESFEKTLELGKGRALIINLDTEQETLLSARLSCPLCDYALPELEPRLFSFNSPSGMCPQCDGLGMIRFIDPKRLVHAPHLSLAEGAIKYWDKKNQNHFAQLTALADVYHFDLAQPFEQLSEAIQKVILYGQTPQTENSYEFAGIIPLTEARYRTTEATFVREELSKLFTDQPCPTCAGARLKKEALHVFIEDKNIQAINQMSLSEALSWFENLHFQSQQKQHIAQKIVLEIQERLRFLNDVGLTYLTLSRSAETLSGGEAQRIRLASQIGSGLTGVLYVLDEPSIGLHQRDNDRLLKTLTRLRDLGNTVIVVEHDQDAILHADHVIDIGPGAGVHGGHIIAQGRPEEIMRVPESLTGQYLSGVKKIERPTKRRVYPTDQCLTIEGATGHNLKNVNLTLPVGLLTCVTGVSGSGKSTLINDTLYFGVANYLHKTHHQTAPYQTIKGLEHFDKIINVDQSPIGRTPRSNPATYTGLFTPIRELFANVPEARLRGYAPGRFSFNVKGGRCEACEGDGVVKVEMHFMPDVYVPCEICHGKRYNRETLEITYKNKNIHDILSMTVEEATVFFEAIPPVFRKLQTLLDVGLGYIQLGQAATTLSGGEAQRVKLALELSKRDTGRTLYILDEPTTGLHFADIDLLLKVLHRLADHGNTVVIIEHNLDVIKTADWIIDLGPEGGSGGGKIIAAGTPEEIVQVQKSYTGQYLKSYLRS